MKNNIYKILCLCAVVLGSVSIGSNIQSMAQTEITHSFPGVMAIAMSSGRVGFFDQGTGKFYVYDDNLSECVFIGQLKALGQPIEQGQ